MRAAHFQCAAGKYMFLSRSFQNHKLGRGISAASFRSKSMFHDYLQDISASGIRKALVELFRILDQKPEQRDKYLADDNPALAAFPYVNDGLLLQQGVVEHAHNLARLQRDLHLFLDVGVPSRPNATPPSCPTPNGPGGLSPVTLPSSMSMTWSGPPAARRSSSCARPPSLS